MAGAGPLETEYILLEGNPLRVSVFGSLLDLTVLNS